MRNEEKSVIIGDWREWANEDELPNERCMEMLIWTLSKMSCCSLDYIIIAGFSIPVLSFKLTYIFSNHFHSASLSFHSPYVRCQLIALIPFNYSLCLHWLSIRCGCVHELER